MARIESLGEFFHFANPPGKKAERKGKTKAFGSVLKESVERSGETEAGAEAPADTDLEDLLDAVHDAGDALKRRQSESAIVAYRRAVQSFVKFVLKKAYDTVRHHSRPNVMKGTQREYLLVRTVDEKLERLVVDVMRNQVEQMELLRRVEEINGLLVDLLT
jgi:uncharacterized protein